MSHGASYDIIGVGYDHHRRADPEIADRIASHLSLRPHGRYVDLACGTGNYTIELASRGGRWAGVDASERMLTEARSKSQSIEWHCGRADDLPLDDAAYDGVTCALAIHHFEALEPAFADVRRVLRPDGSFVCFTSTAEQMEAYWLIEYWPRAMRRSIEQMPSFARLEHDLELAGLRLDEIDPYVVSPTLSDSFLYRGKHNPSYYFDAEVRRASSTFAMLADPEEVRLGCERLAADIESGRFEAVRQHYLAMATQPPGDYLFFRAGVAA